MNMENHSGIISTEENRITGRKSCSSAILTTIKSSWTDLGRNRGRHHEKGWLTAWVVTRHWRRPQDTIVIIVQVFVCQQGVSQHVDYVVMTFILLTWSNEFCSYDANLFSFGYRSRSSRISSFLLCCHNVSFFACNEFYPLFLWFCITLLPCTGFTAIFK
jgi:hypothetical protein